MFLKSPLILLLIATVLSGCGNGNPSIKAFNKKYNTECEAFEGITREAIANHFSVPVSEYASIREKGIKKLAKNLGVDEPKAGSNNCLDIQEIGKNFEEKTNIEFTPRSLFSHAIDAFVSSLDPHSRFEFRASRADFDRRSKGINKNKGVGLELRKLIQNRWLPIQTLFIDNVFKGTPAANKLIAGDQILEINDLPVKDMMFQDALDHIQDLKNEVKFKVGRLGEVTLPLVNYLAPLESHRIPKPRIGYIKLRTFLGPAFKAFIEGLNEIINSIDILIFDLRGDFGGFDIEAAKIVTLFRGGGPVIKYEGPINKKVKKKSDQTIEISKDLKPIVRIPVVILTNQETVSASEITTGALWPDRALVIGDRTYGKGIAQTRYPIGSKTRLPGLLLLTMSRYSFQDGFSPQVVGIPPHISIPEKNLVEEVAKQRKKDKDLILTEEDYGEDAVPAKSTAEREYSPELHELADEITKQMDQGDYKNVCGPDSDCPLEMALAFIPTILASKYANQFR